MLTRRRMLAMPIHNEKHLLNEVLLRTDEALANMNTLIQFSNH